MVRPEPDPQHAYLRRVLNGLEYEDGQDCPQWITGLRKPVRSEDLDEVQNMEVKMQWYDAEIERLVALRATLPIPPTDHEANDRHDGSARKIKKKGLWIYEHWGRTQEVHGEGLDKTVARGLWKFITEEGVSEMLLDEWPRDVWGDPIRWAKVRKSTWEQQKDGEWKEIEIMEEVEEEKVEEWEYGFEDDEDADGEGEWDDMDEFGDYDDGYGDDEQDGDGFEEEHSGSQDGDKDTMEVDFE